MWDFIISNKIRFGCSNNLSSRTVASQVFSALVSLTTVFGMRTGGTSPLTSPQWYIYEYSLEHIVFSGIYIIYLFSSVVNFFTRQIYNCIDLFFDLLVLLSPWLIIVRCFSVINSSFSLNFLRSSPRPISIG